MRTTTVRQISALMFHIQSLCVPDGHVTPHFWDQGTKYTVLPGRSILVSGSDSWNAPDPWGAVSYNSDVEKPSSEGTQRPKRHAKNETSGEGRSALRRTTTRASASSGRQVLDAEPGVEPDAAFAAGESAPETSHPPRRSSFRPSQRRISPASTTIVAISCSLSHRGIRVALGYNSSTQGSAGQN